MKKKKKSLGKLAFLLTYFVLEAECENPKWKKRNNWQSVSPVKGYYGNI